MKYTSIFVLFALLSVGCAPVQLPPVVPETIQEEATVPAIDTELKPQRLVGVRNTRFSCDTVGGNTFCAQGRLLAGSPRR